MNHNKLITCAIALVLWSSHSARSMTVNWAAAQTNQFTLADQITGVPIGALVQIGNFGALSDLQIAAIGADPLSLQTSFESWASGSIGDGTDASPLGVGTFSLVSTAPGNGFFSESIYLLVFNTSSAGTATQVGVFKGTQVNTSESGAWIFPASDLSPAASIETIGVGPSGVIIGSFGANTFASPWWGEDVNALALQVVPEPTSFMLVGIGLLGAFVVRRRMKA